MSATHLIAHEATTYLAINNPIDGIIPNFNIFGAKFDTWWKKLFGGAWALAILWMITTTLMAVVSARKARHAGVAEDMDSARSSAITHAVILAVVVGFGVIISLILSIASPS